jgi:hypothetical protein
MGIIISSFIGCGREYLKNSYGDKVKIFDAVEEIPMDEVTDDALEEYINKVMSVVDENDIVFIGSSEKIRDAFNERSIDYDVFYPSEERRGEFIENQVRKRVKPKHIQALDKDFAKWVKEIDDDESENCYKHKLSHFGEFIGNSPIIMQYIDNLKNQKQNQGNTPNNNEENNDN